ncbi:hypothetical protein ABDK00_014020 [Niabella insulamsoli]|uniref:hypothetical protein n=1 Tax=Niabella insulamsoli TaxID=3144874 RepID=UPI0031FCE859
MGEVIIGLQSKIEGLKNPDGLLRTVALSVLPEMRKRVHVEGKDSTDSQIGTYSSAYMKVRTGDYANSDRVIRGKNKGKVKNAGYFTKGQNATYDVKTQKANLARPNYRRGSDTKVILSLTSQMENDMSVMATSDGYGIGYNNPFNLKKALWNEERYKKKILSALSQGEVELVITVAENYIEENLK